MNPVTKAIGSFERLRTRRTHLAAARLVARDRRQRQSRLIAAQIRATTRAALERA